VSGFAIRKPLLNWDHHPIFDFDAANPAAKAPNVRARSNVRNCLQLLKLSPSDSGNRNLETIDPVVLRLSGKSLPQQR
jgi:hypothetical protein